MGITFKTFLDCVDLVTEVNKPVLLRSRHGVGKSTVVYDYAKQKGLQVVERRASQMTEGDLLGLPIVSDGEATRWLPPAWFKNCCDNARVLFIDEIDRATTEVRQGFFELTDSRKLAGHTLHPDTLIFAAVNGGEHGAQYQVGEMDPAELDRWTVFDLEPSVDDWLAWARKRDDISEVITDFINENSKHLEHAQGNFEPNKVYPSRRSWHRFSQVFTANESKLFTPGKNNLMLINIARSFVGMEAAHAFNSYVQNKEKEVTADDILKDGKVELTEGFTLDQHNNLIEKIVEVVVKRKNFGKKFLDNLSAYWITLPSEVGMAMWKKTAVNIDDQVKFGKIHNHPPIKKYVVACLEVGVFEEENEK